MDKDTLHLLYGSNTLAIVADDKQRAAAGTPPQHVNMAAIRSDLMALTTKLEKALRICR